jgi:hypothetical protein
MFDNPNELKDHWLTAYWIEYIPSSADEDGVKSLPSFSEDIKTFRYRRYQGQGAKREETSIMSGRVGVDGSISIETRSRLPFKQEDLLLDSLELLPYGQTNRFGLRYAKWSRVGSVRDEIDEDADMSNLMFKTGFEIKQVLVATG